MHLLVHPFSFLLFRFDRGAGMMIHKYIQFLFVCLYDLYHFILLINGRNVLYVFVISISDIGVSMLANVLYSSVLEDNLSICLSVNLSKDIC